MPPDVAEYAQRFEQFPATQGQGSESERLRKLFDLFWEFQMHASPEYATFVGYPASTTAGPTSRRSRSSSAAGSARSSRRPWRRSTARSSTPAEQVNYDLALRHVREGIEGERFHGEYLLISQVGGPQQGIPQLLSIMPGRSVKDYENIIARMRGVPG